MRLQLVVVAIVLATAAGARAEPGAPTTASGSVRVYTDHVTVVSPRAGVDARLGARSSLGVEVVADAISAASVDVVTSASPATVHETRLELAGTYARRLPLAARTTGSVAVRVSHEHDYDAVRATAGVRAEVAQRNTTLDVQWVAGHDIASSASDAAFRRARDGHQVIATIGQLLGRRTVADVITELAWARGYHASPYRQVAIEQASWPMPILVEEVTPSRRVSAAVAVRVRHAVTRAVFASATYRAYQDDWAITSHTATAEVLYEPSERWLLGGQVRGYIQDGARFYAARYDATAGVPALRTRDRTLGPMRTAYAALTADRDVARDWHVVLAAGVLWMRFLEFPAQAERRAFTMTASVVGPL